MLRARKLHRIIGIILLLPMFGWSITGVVFFIKPGYGEAYEQLAIKTYPLDDAQPVELSWEWQEVRVIRSILGNHLLVKSDQQAWHLDPVTQNERPVPVAEDVAKLVNDAISHNKERYGMVDDLQGLEATTTTGITIQLNWNTLKLKQRGNDTNLIDAIYKIHYLQWTPNVIINQILGIFGLFLLMVTSILGFKLILRGR